MAAMHDCVTERPDLGTCLQEWAGDDSLHTAVADTIRTIATAGLELARELRRSMLADDHDDIVGHNADGDRQRRIDVTAHELLLSALRATPVAAVASEEAADVVTLQSGAPLLVALDPLDGSANLAVDAPAGMIFSLRLAPTSGEATAATFLTPGAAQLAAGLVLFGPTTLLALTVGTGTDIYAVDDSMGAFRRIRRDLRTPTSTREYAINTSNARHWSPAIRAYIDDLTTGTKGPRRADFNMRWFGALVADAYRILTRGGIFLYPGDERPSYGKGRLRLLYEAQPIAMLFEQAGGAATDGSRRILDLTAAHLHARTPLVFGSADKVARVTRYNETASHDAEHAPLFGTRGLFRDER
jgi:fructose-1,6-bisphosphatase I